MIDFGRAVQHPFEDRDWFVKILIGAGVSLIPILNFAIMGYSLEVLRNSSHNRDVPLPSWDDLGRHFMDGLKLFVVMLVYSIPLFIIIFGIAITGVGFGLISDRMSQSAQEAVGLGFGILTLAFTCLSFLYGIAYAFIQPALYIQVARTGRIGSGFDFKEIKNTVKRNSGDYVIVVLIPLMIGFAFSIVFGIIGLIPFAGLCLSVLMIPVILFMVPYIEIVFGHLYGQLLRG